MVVRFSGPTIHFVDEHYDTGRILAQRVVPVLANDTAEELAARVLKEVMADYIMLDIIFIIFSLCFNSLKRDYALVGSSFS